MKRKAIPQWIREALEKREKEKQRELAKQQEEKENPAEQEDVKVDVIKEEVKEEEKKPFFKIKVRDYLNLAFPRSYLYKPWPVVLIELMCVEHHGGK